MEVNKSFLLAYYDFFAEGDFYFPFLFWFISFMIQVITEFRKSLCSFSPSSFGWGKVKLLMTLLAFLLLSVILFLCWCITYSFMRVFRFLIQSRTRYSCFINSIHFFFLTSCQLFLLDCPKSLHWIIAASSHHWLELNFNILITIGIFLCTRLSNCK